VRGLVYAGVAIAMRSFTDAAERLWMEAQFKRRGQ
jgi:hypothetical protein